MNTLGHIGVNLERGLENLTLSGHCIRKKQRRPTLRVRVNAWQNTLKEEYLRLPKIIMSKVVVKRHDPTNSERKFATEDKKRKKKMCQWLA